MKKFYSLTFRENGSHNRFDEHLSVRESSQPRHGLPRYDRLRNRFRGAQIQFPLSVVRDRTPPQNSSAVENS